MKPKTGRATPDRRPDHDRDAPQGTARDPQDPGAAPESARARQNEGQVESGGGRGKPDR